MISSRCSCSFVDLCHKKKYLRLFLHARKRGKRRSKRTRRIERTLLPRSIVLRTNELKGKRNPFIASFKVTFRPSVRLSLSSFFFFLSFVFFLCLTWLHLDSHHSYCFVLPSFYCQMSVSFRFSFSHCIFLFSFCIRLFQSLTPTHLSTRKWRKVAEERERQK